FAWRAPSPNSDLLPGAIVYRVVVGGARHGHVPLHRPAVGVVPALAGVGLRRAVQKPPGVELLGLEKPAGLAHEVMSEGPRVLVQHLYRARLRAEHFPQRIAVEIIARGFGAR